MIYLCVHENYFVQVDSEEEETKRLAEIIKEKKKLIIQAHRAKKMMKNRPVMPRTVITKV